MTVVWHRGFTCKLLRLLSDKHMVRIIMEYVRNRSFTVTTSDIKQSRPRHLKNGVLLGFIFFQHSYLQSALHNFQKAYLCRQSSIAAVFIWKLEGTLSQDMITLSAYLQTWRLKLSHTKTVTVVFHLNNQDAKRELKAYISNRFFQFCPTSSDLGVKLNR